MLSRIASLGRRALVPATLLATFASLVRAQEREPYVADPDRPALEQPELSTDPMNAFEFAISGDALSFAYRNGLHRGDGYVSLGLLASNDNDFALAGKFMRFAEPSSATPIGLGVGLGLLGARIDEPHADVFAITLTGAVDYALELQYPLRLGLEVNYAPAAATFADGDRVLDVLARAEADLSSWATAFVGYRHFEIGLDNEKDQELDTSLQLGVRLGF